jgi:hypothetical protein
MKHQTLALAFEWLAVLFWGWVIFRLAFSKKPLPGPFRVPCRIIRFILIVLTFGLLAGCSNPDPLAVASGPLFPLNAGHWQPTPQDLASPPAVADK